MNDIKILLNEYEDPKLSECVYVGIGDEVYANDGAVEYGFNKHKKYVIKDVQLCGYLKLTNDIGITDWYTTEYFSDYEHI